MQQEHMNNVECGMAVVICRNKILSVKELIFGQEILSLPKGHKETNEDILDTAIRECYEETNVKIKRSELISYLPSYSYEFVGISNKKVHKSIIPLLFEISQERKVLAKEYNMLEVKWMDIDEFINLCPFESVKKIVLAALRIIVVPTSKK